MSMKKIKPYIIFLIGLIIFGTGLAFANESMLGSDPMAVFCSGLTIVTALSFGTCNLFVNIFEGIFGFIFDRKRVTIVTVIAMFIASYTIDFAAYIIPDTTNIIIRVIYMLCGVVFLSLGISLQVIANVGLGAMDCFIFGLGKLLKIEEYHKVRWIVDGFFLIIGILLHGVFNIGTILFIAFTGILMEFFKKRFEWLMK